VGLVVDQRRWRYLPQLDGLRTVAVLLVIGTHTGFIPGGYVGVDVFFALSGYLITSILLGQHRDGRWSLKAFYIRRAKRLYPALLLMLIVTLPFGSKLGPGFGHYCLAVGITAVYLSDFVAAANVHWLGGLVHTWSLAVEEQFYLLWPFTLAFLQSRGRRFTWTALTLFTLTMLLLLSTLQASSALYLPFTRGSTLLLGCMLALVLQDRTLRWPTPISLIGAVVLITLVVTAAAAGTPGAALAAAFAGSASTILIAGLIHGGLVARVLSARPMVWLGRRSYAIYLWHVPIVYIAADRQLAPLHPEWGVLAAALPGSVLLAAISYALVENRFLRRDAASQKVPASSDAVS
jgi:peptidoglycan/LPS O-acetylase OafA/YrhL